MEDNSHAGQGPVLLDIGGDIGALVVTVDASLDGAEIEIRPVAGATTPVQGGSGHAHQHGHQHDDGEMHHPSIHGDHGDHADHGDHGDHGGALPHVAVLGRPVGNRIIHSAVFAELAEGAYELYLRPDGPVQLTAAVVGGQVTEANWPVPTG